MEFQSMSIPIPSALPEPTDSDRDVLVKHSNSPIPVTYDTHAKVGDPTRDTYTSSCSRYK